MKQAVPGGHSVEALHIAHHGLVIAKGVNGGDAREPGSHTAGHPSGVQADVWRIRQESGGDSEVDFRSVGKL